MYENNNYLIKEKIGKLLLKFSIPCTISLLISALYNIVDQIFIGNSNVGTIGNTATSLVFPIITIGLALGLMLGDGTASYISLCMGRGDTKKVGKAIGTATVVGIIIGVLFIAICFPLLDQILTFLGARTPESLAAAKEYAVWILIGMPFFVLLNALNPIIRADGYPKVAMASTLSGCIANIILDAIFIYPCNMGLTGAAMATTIGIVLSLIVSLFAVIKPKSFKWELKDFIPDLRILWQEIKQGFSSFLTQFSIVIITIVSMNMLAQYGAESKYGANDPQAIIGVIMKVFSIAINIAVGISSGAQPIIGYNYGAKRYDRVKQTIKYVYLAVIITGVIFTVLFETIPGPILSIFGTNSSNPDLYLEFGIKALRIYLMFILFTSIQKTTSITLQSLGKPVQATILSLARDVISFVPFTICLPFALGLDGILWAAPCADGVGIIVSAIFLFIELNKMSRHEKDGLSAVKDTL